jgi:hypothetical protein
MNVYGALKSYNKAVVYNCPLAEILKWASTDSLKPPALSPIHFASY